MVRRLQEIAQKAVRQMDGANKTEVNPAVARQVLGASVQLFFAGSVESGQLVQNKAHNLPDNIVLTDAHLLTHGSGTIKIKTADGNAYAGKILKIDKDMAWLEVQNLPHGLPHVQIADASEVPIIPANSNLPAESSTARVMAVGHDGADPKPVLRTGAITGMTSKAGELQRADRLNAQAGVRTHFYQDYQSVVDSLPAPYRAEAQADFTTPLYQTKVGCTNGGSGGQLDNLNGHLIGICESSQARSSLDDKNERETFIPLPDILRSLGTASGPNAASALSSSSEYTFEYANVPNDDESISTLSVPKLIAIHRKNGDKNPPFNAGVQIQQRLW